MEANKSLDPDGFSMGFYQFFWDIIKDDLIKVMAEFQDRPLNIKRFNSTFIVLSAHEATFAQKSFRKERVLVKLDFEKTYDRVSWEVWQFPPTRKQLALNAGWFLLGVALFAAGAHLSYANIAPQQAWTRARDDLLRDYLRKKYGYEGGSKQQR